MLSSPDVAHLDRMRRTRNRSEYGPVIVGAAQVSSDLAHARGIVAAARTFLETTDHEGAPDTGG